MKTIELVMELWFSFYTITLWYMTIELIKRHKFAAFAATAHVVETRLHGSPARSIDDPLQILGSIHVISTVIPP